MTNNFDLRKFLTENSLTKTARVIKEESDTTGHPDHKPTPKTTPDQDKEALKQFLLRRPCAGSFRARRNTAFERTSKRNLSWCCAEDKKAGVKEV